jgi:transcription-repair coupling factor (superfamily II helicase)
MLNNAVRKAKGEEVLEEDEDVKIDKPLINVSTHIDDEYVDDAELKILIHKRINEVDSYDSFCTIKEELEDRFGKLSEDLVIYMYEEWFSKLAKKIGIEEIIDNDKYVDMTLPVNINEKIKGDKLFELAYDVNRNFKLNFKHNHIHIILEKNKLEKHYLMYLIAILIRIFEKIK